jgi:hypothetical protein
MPQRQAQRRGAVAKAAISRRRWARRQSSRIAMSSATQVAWATAGGSAVV